MPPAMPARMTRGTWITVGADTLAPATAATSAPMAYWPSTPMLNRPALKPIATARPAKMNGVARPKMNANELRLTRP